MQTFSIIVFSDLLLGFKLFLRQSVLWSVEGSPSFLFAGGLRVAQLVRILLLPSHWPAHNTLYWAAVQQSHLPFIRAIAFSASTFFMKETKP